jgi:hypothetical protein
MSFSTGTIGLGSGPSLHFAQGCGQPTHGVSRLVQPNLGIFGTLRRAPEIIGFFERRKNSVLHRSVRCFSKVYRVVNHRKTAYGRERTIGRGQSPRTHYSWASKSPKFYKACVFARAYDFFFLGVTGRRTRAEIKQRASAPPSGRQTLGSPARWCSRPPSPK